MALALALLLLAATLPPEGGSSVLSGREPAPATSPLEAQLLSAPILARITTLQQERPLTIRVDRENGFRPIVRVGPVLGDGELERAATSGLPLRVRVRVELWRDRLFDQLVDTTSWSTVIVHEPIAEQYLIRSLPADRGTRRASSFAAARAAVESEYLLSMRPRREGRYYYTVSLQIETLSVSDLEELERWLQGELQPAVSGERSVTGAVGQGAKRLMLRILDLPERRYDARTERFTAG